MVRFYSRGQQPCQIVGTKERVCIRKEFNRIGLGHQNTAGVTSCEDSIVAATWKSGFVFSEFQDK